MWDTLEMIYGVSQSIKQEEMNTRGEEDESITHQCSTKFRISRNYIGTFITNQYLRVKS